ncbi:hypothetical protein VC83_02776 [Pseudogymnoascus destructans]|uniref:Uncharacterized protein n=1 Tax=Pseudogymnoascus destructans TaxID=655981 RepID=A0A177AFM3_9PEZI|nr:uncharacterized protein VC83_02776 [Pseudogymnoascus destructans]OAF60051.1 hypothetical protein VC83_02776 [Pseudogymnoascus destructans]
MDTKWSGLRDMLVADMFGAGEGFPGWHELERERERERERTFLTASLGQRWTQHPHHHTTCSASPELDLETIHLLLHSPLTTDLLRCSTVWMDIRTLAPQITPCRPSISQKHVRHLRSHHPAPQSRKSTCDPATISSSFFPPAPHHQVDLGVQGSWRARVPLSSFVLPPKREYHARQTLRTWVM